MILASWRVLLFGEVVGDEQVEGVGNFEAVAVAVHLSDVDASGFDEGCVICGGIDASCTFVCVGEGLFAEPLGSLDCSIAASVDSCSVDLSQRVGDGRDGDDSLGAGSECRSDAFKHLCRGERPGCVVYEDVGGFVVAGFESVGD